MLSVRYYHINRDLHAQFLPVNVREEKPRDVRFEDNTQTMSFPNVLQRLERARNWFFSFAYLQVRQWVNSAFEQIECVLFHEESRTFEKGAFYLSVYGEPVDPR